MKISAVFFISLAIAFTARAYSATTNEGININMGSDGQTIFAAGDNHVAYYRIPAIIRAKNGDLIAMADARRVNIFDLNHGDPINIAIRRSQDNGQTWSPIEFADNLPKGMSASNPSLVLDRETGALFCFYNVWDNVCCPGIYMQYVQKSSDNGITWETPCNITGKLRRKEWGIRSFIFIPSGHGCQLKDGTLLHTINWVGHDIMLFGSEDHGATWRQIGNPVSPGAEGKVIELTDGTLMINTGVSSGPCRWVHLSEDRGETWESHEDKQLRNPSCNASIVRYNDRLLFLNADHESKKANLTLKESFDEGKTWSVVQVIEPGFASYFDMTVLPDGKIGIIYEADNCRTIKFKIVRID